MTPPGYWLRVDKERGINGEDEEEDEEEEDGEEKENNEDQTLSVGLGRGCYVLNRISACGGIRGIVRA